MCAWRVRMTCAHVHQKQNQQSTTKLTIKVEPCPHACTSLHNHVRTHAPASTIMPTPPLHPQATKSQRAQREKKRESGRWRDRHEGEVREIGSSLLPLALGYQSKKGVHVRGACLPCFQRHLLVLTVWLLLLTHNHGARCVYLTRIWSAWQCTGNA